MLKWLVGIGLAVLLGIGIAGYYLYSNLDSLVAQAIEEYGSEAAGVAVRVDRVALDLEAGRASIFGLRVSNPPGFKGEHAFTLGEITVDIDLESLAEQNPIVLDEIRIEAPIVYFELNKSRQANLDVLKDNATKAGSEDSSAEPTESSGPETRIAIRRLRFSGGRVEADTQAVGGNEIDAKLGTAELSNVGGQKGATGGEIGAVVVKELSRQTVAAIGRGQIENLVKDKLGKDGQKAVDAVGGLLDRFGR